MGFAGIVSRTVGSERGRRLDRTEDPGHAGVIQALHYTYISDNMKWDEIGSLS